MSADPAAPDRLGTAARVEARVQVAIMLAIGAAAGAASFTHVRDVAAAHGQSGWLAWADAVVLELMSIASGLELRRRRRRGHPVGFPATVLVCAVVLSIAAQVVEAEPSEIGWIATALPALGFLVMVKIALGATAPRGGTRTVGSRPPADVLSLGPVPPSTDAVPDTEDRPAHVPLDGDDHRPPDGPVKSSDDDLVSQAGAGAARGDRSHAETRVEVDVVPDLPAARRARDSLIAEGRPLTRRARSSATKSSPPPSSTGCCTTATSSRSTDPATGSRTA